MEENTETVQHLKEERSRREAEISGLNKKVDLLVKDLSDKTGSASEAYSKLNEMHQVKGLFT
jgi:predicted  nucleic acid-binding Zn-ribbon protein